MFAAMKLSAIPALLRDVNGANVNVIRTAWDVLAAVPGGARVFSRMVGRAAPYTATIGATVRSLGLGHAQVELRDRRGLRNHLRSVHAVALANLVELAGNIALAYSLPDDARFIVKRMTIDYLKKARGTLRAESRCPVPADSERCELEVTVDVFDRAGEVVATGILLSVVGPKTRPR